ncbi:AAA family ATPase CDC48 subfamily protein (macronuclear) [Tetrahymena thermophila SB210]|uniref:AAA family ATPase CDC48 subfamily protein n=1 Tax=Tetrahymena thermophila (strain SB210) TaxID=312017 RepID=Q23BU3_TETTS|nr:AAA family ATPase CDC48 subfamily protein [Tetrahymena thermophila SB210]EAR94025.2 AAA family ATPase CDC48 subfamily protein [Tetrahymena thermophila SB210]|eukprot:XP_001014270.2 AAA family ATPase CDC48 subfamily protein [Tetrahymena thermophila SB210]
MKGEKKKFDKYGLYCEYSQQENLQINTFLMNCILNYQEKKYTKDNSDFKRMLNDYASPDLKKNFFDGNFEDMDFDNPEHENLMDFISYISDFIYKMQDILIKMQKFDGKQSFQEYLESFYQTIMKQNRRQDMESLNQMLSQKKEFQYFILFDPYWKDAFKELVKIFQGINNAENIETKMGIKVSFKSKEARNMFNLLCAQCISQFKLIKQQDVKSICEHAEFEKLKIQALKTVFANFVIFRHTNVQKQFFSSQQQNLLDLHLFTPEISSKEDQSLMTYQQNPYILLPQNMHIQLIDQKKNPLSLVKSMKLVIQNKDYDYISYEENEELDIQLQNQDKSKYKKLEYFITYFYYYNEEDEEDQQSRYAFVPAQVLDDGVKSMQQSCFGLDGFLQNSQMQSLLEEFKNPLRFYECKGPLIYGPPGTGKTFIIQKMIKYFQIHLIFDGNSSTFQTSLQGQGSRMLTYYFNRARAIPWQPCAAHIGEIEQLVKKKDKDGGGSSEVLNKLLELTDGTETVGNIKIFSTTNHVEMIEEAILSRFRQVYLGKSNTPLRRDWIVWYLLQNKNQSEDNFKSIIQGFIPDVEDFIKQSEKEQEKQLKDAIQDIVSYTVNFSTRQLKALMSNITSKILFGELNYQSQPEQKLKCILNFCKSLGEDNFMFGSKSLPQTMFDCLNQNPSEFVNQLLNESNQKKQDNSSQQLILMDSLEDELNSQEVQLFIDENFEYSKVVFIDQSTVQNERISILKQKQRISQKIHLYKKVEDMYYKLEILVGTILKCQQFKHLLQEIEDSISKFGKLFIDLDKQLQFYRDYQQNKKKLQLPQEIFTLLQKTRTEQIKKYEELKSGINAESNNGKKVKLLPIDKLREIDNLFKVFKELIQQIDKQINKVRDDIDRYTSFLSLEQKLGEIKDILIKDNSQIDFQKLIKNQEAFANNEANKLLMQLKKIIRADQLEYMEVEQIIKQKRFYQVNFCSLRDPSYDNIMVLLAEFINRGDFSKVDMVDYHSCERNNAFKDINSFKDYISNLTKEGKEEEKSLIVYKLDEILDVTEAEDTQIEKDRLQMAIKIFQTINVDTTNSNMWSIFISKNQNVIDLFYNTVTYWPKQSIKGKLIQIQQEQLKLIECKFCGKTFKESDEEDQCKAHISDEFFIEKNTEKYKKFEGDWFGPYLEEYYKRQKHAKEHKNNSLSSNESQQDKLTKKSCTYCENYQEFKIDNYSLDLYELNADSFKIMKSNSIIPQYLKSFEQIINLKQPIQLEEVKRRIQKREAFANEFKRVCCQGDYYKEQCNPHKHQKKEEITEESIKQEIYVYIKNKIQELK